MLFDPSVFDVAGAGKTILLIKLHDLREEGTEILPLKLSPPELKSLGVSSSLLKVLEGFQVGDK